MNPQIIKSRLTTLREGMRKNQADALYIPTSDFHDSEYAGAFFACREFFSGFSGSAGTLVVLQDQAGLWTDGRYFLQAQEQLKDTGITLYKMGNEGVPTIRKFLEDTLKAGEVLGFDGRCVSFGQASGLAASMQKKGICVNMETDLAGRVWEEMGERPQLSSEEVWELSECYAGKKREEKILDVRKKMQEQGADVLLISSLDDIAWLLNLRGNDIACVPVFLSYMLVEKNEIKLYAMQQAFSDKIRERLKQEGIFLFPYESIYDDLPKLGEGQKVWFDQLRTNAALVNKIPNTCQVIKKQLPTIMMKAVKNEVEIENERKAHLYDGIAFCKFLYWLKQQKKETLTEISAAEKLEEFRKRQEHYIEPSFEPISAYAEHGAIVHYSATEESNARLSGENFLLMDTGAHYYEGSTDITRTIALGELTRKQKEHYTAVLRGNCNLGAAKFCYGCCGINLDILARSPLWEQGLDFNHGTGHGVGYLLNVHEAPNNIRMNARAKDSRTILEEGMITSNEPGLYLEGEYGIRLENLILCKKAEKTDFGQFMEFETLTLVPFERDAILPELMTQREKELLNRYHSMVFEQISPYLDKEEKAWLKEATKAV